MNFNCRAIKSFGTLFLLVTVLTLTLDSFRSIENHGPVTNMPPPVLTIPSGAAAVEQRSQGSLPGAELAASFDGLGAGFEGPQGTAALRNPSDNTLAVGPNHIFQIVNTRMAIFTKKGKLFDTTGKVLYGPVPTSTLFKGFGGACEAINNGDAEIG